MLVYRRSKEVLARLTEFIIAHARVWTVEPEMECRLGAISGPHANLVLAVADN
jgi:hypothetical protein